MDNGQKEKKENEARTKQNKRIPAGGMDVRVVKAKCRIITTKKEVRKKYKQSTRECKKSHVGGVDVCLLCLLCR
jgi:hypothetical protein